MFTLDMWLSEDILNLLAFKLGMNTQHFVMRYNIHEVIHTSDPLHPIGGQENGKILYP